MPASRRPEELQQLQRIADRDERQGNALVVVRVPEAELAVPEPLEHEEAGRQELAAERSRK